MEEIRDTDEATVFPASSDGSVIRAVARNENQNNNEQQQQLQQQQQQQQQPRRAASRDVSAGRQSIKGRRSDSADGEEREFQFGPRIRGRSKRRALKPASTFSAPLQSDAGSDQQSRVSSHEENRSPGRSPGRSPVVPVGMSLVSQERSSGRSPIRSAGNLNGLVDLAAFRDAEESGNRDGSTHRAGSLFLPSATWTPPSLRDFGFPSEFKGFVEVNLVRLLTPTTQKVWSVLAEDLNNIPNNWKMIPATRRVGYAVTAFVSGYYLLVSLYAIPVVALGFLAPAYICRKYVENEEEGDETANNNNNDDDDVDDVIVSIKEMSRWMKFWVSFCGWLLASSLAPRIVAAILPLKILTLLFVVASLVGPWAMNPAILAFDRLLLPLFHRVDDFFANYKDKIIDAVSNVQVKSKRRRD